MEPQDARRIIDTLTQGLDPLTGEPIPPGSPFHAPDVVRALHAASQALAARVARPVPPNAGKAWQAEEDSKVEAAFTAGIDFRSIAADVGRTAFAVEARLVKLGKIPPRPGMRV